MSIGYVDASFECDYLRASELVGNLKRKPTRENLDTMARALQALSWEIRRVLEYYGDEYKNNYKHILTIADEALDAALLVPETVTRIDGGDRSAHAHVVRMRARIKSHILQYTESI